MQGYPEALSAHIDRHPDITVEQTTDTPAGQCEWCQMQGAVCCLSVEWEPRPDVTSVGASESCLDCVRFPIRWALDDARDDSTIRVAYAAGVAA